MNKEKNETETKTTIPSVPLPNWKDKPTDRIIMTDEIRMAEDALEKALSDGVEDGIFDRKVLAALCLVLHPQTRKELIKAAFTKEDGTTYTDRYVTKILKSFGDRILSVPDAETGEKVLYLKGTAAEYERSRDYQPTAALAGFTDRMESIFVNRQQYLKEKSFLLDDVLHEMHLCADPLINPCPTSCAADTPSSAEGLGLLAQKPFLPVVIASSGNGTTLGYMIDNTCVSVERGEFLPLCLPWVNYTLQGQYYLNRGEFEMDLSSHLRRIWPDLTGQTEEEIQAMCEGQKLEETPEFQERLKKELADYDLYWEDCIILRPASKNPD